MREPLSRKKYLRIFLAVNVGALAVALLYAAAFTLAARHGLGIFDCTVKNALGIYCPGCGGSRAVLCLLHFDLFGMAKYYPPFVPLLLFFLYFDVSFFLTLVTGDGKYAGSVRYRLLWIPLVTVIVTFFVRLILLLGFGIDPLGDLIPAAV